MQEPNPIPARPRKWPARRLRSQTSDNAVLVYSESSASPSLLDYSRKPRSSIDSYEAPSGPAVIDAAPDRERRGRPDQGCAKYCENGESEGVARQVGHGGENLEKSAGLAPDTGRKRTQVREQERRAGGAQN